MRLIARFTSAFAGLLGLGCIVGAVRGFRAASALADPALVRDSRGFAGFLVFLGLVFAAIAVLGWRYLGEVEE